MKQQHHPTDVRTYHTGVNSDTNKELLGTTEGDHVDSLNMRSLSMDGDNSAKKKIKGEQELFPNIDNRCNIGTGLPLDSSYECMMSMEIMNKIIEIWANPDPENNPPLMRIDGKIVLMSSGFPIDLEHPLQYDKNENCVGGEIYITNNNTAPMVFSMKDLLINAGVSFGGEEGNCSTKYFDEFNIEEYTVNISAILHKPFFVKSDASSFGYDKVFGSAGLPVGYYSYSYRFVTTDGDRSQWSPLTELIPVANSFSTNDSIFPALRSYSKDPDISSPSPYGNHIKIRIENFNNFEAIEVRRDAYNSGQPIGETPISSIIGIMNVNDGVYVLNIIDRASPSEVEEVITIDEQLNQLTGISRAKSIRYYNERLYLMNIGYASKDIDEEVVFNDEATTGNIIPVVEKIGKFGHKNSFNGTHYKSDMRGDRKGFGVALFDGDGNISYVKKIDGAENFTFPNRRNEVNSESIGLSYHGTVTAANTEGTVTETYEVFDHKNASTKSGSINGSIVKPFLTDPGYDPLNPTKQTDPASDHDKRINIKYSNQSGHLGAGSFADYNPRCFGIDYYSLGVAFKGIEQFPSWASGFSIVQTESVKRVVAQGLGFYDLKSAGKGAGSVNGGKETNSVAVYFPDLDEVTGLNPAILDDILLNPTSYSIQFVSPLGYFSEVYTFEHGFIHNSLVDMITYCRVLHDEGQINPPVGISDFGGINGGGKSYVGYGANRYTQGHPIFTGNGNGDATFGIQGAGVQEVTTDSGRSKYLTIRTNESVYLHNYASGQNNADDVDVMKWQEPIYIVNIIKSEVQVPDNNTTQYKYTGHYVKLESLIGQGINDSLVLDLVSERWEDCIRTVSTHVTNAYASLERFVYVENDLGEKQKWVNVTGKTTSEVNSILTDIQNNGFAIVTDSSGSYTVFGVYQSEDYQLNSDARHRGFRIKFEEFTAFPKETMIPAIGRKIYVRYDNRIPVRVFGGDTWINESVWAYKDIAYNKNANIVNSSSVFYWDLPIPKAGYQFPNSYRIVRNTKPITGNRIQDESTFKFKRAAGWNSEIRQWIIMATVETRINLSLAFNDEGVLHSSDQFFPLKNYVMRPHRWDDSKDDLTEFYDDNHVYAQYQDDYGDERVLWGLGGFRFKPQTNTDYSQKETTLLLTSTPKIGFNEQTEFCTRVLWSETRPINAQFTATVRTFPANNFYDLSDDTGEIKFAWSAISSDKGNNLYAITDSGVALLLIDKRIIHEINANELATVGSDIGGVLNHLWINKSVGMSDETWRTWAEYSNVLFFHNKKGSYMLGDNQLQNITETGWQEIYLKRIAPFIGSGYSTKLAGVYNTLTKEYIMQFDPSTNTDNNPLVPISSIFGTEQNKYQCRSSYNYDKYLSFSNKLYGMKNMVTYELGVGNQLSGSDIECSVVGLSDKDMYFDKEFIRIRVNSNSKPKQIKFYDSYDEYLNQNPSSVVDSDLNPIAIKDYFGYECYIPRKSVAPYNRQQGRVVLFEVVSSADENFLVSSTGIQYKALK